MGNRAYLIKTSGESSGELFEGVNTIPLFWFNLLDVDSIKNNEKDLIKYYNNNNDDDDGSESDEYTIKLSKNTFMNNLHAGKIFIENHYSDKLNLYNDFINYLDRTFTEDDVLELELLETANFFDGAENFIETVKTILTNIQSNVNSLVPFEPDKSVFSFVGFMEILGAEDEFVNYSREYAAYCENTQKEHNEKLEKERFKQRVYEIKGKASGIFLCIAGIAFIGGGIYGFIKTGNYFMGLVSVLFGSLSVLTGILKLKKIITL